MEYVRAVAELGLDEKQFLAGIIRAVWAAAGESFTEDHLVLASFDVLPGLKREEL